MSETFENSLATLRTFNQLVASLEEGQLHTDLTNKLSDLVRDLNQALVVDRKASGTIVLTIKMTADRGVIETIGDVKVKTPPPARVRSMLYVSGGQHLCAHNPNQMQLPLRTVPVAPTEVRTAN